MELTAVNEGGMKLGEYRDAMASLVQQIAEALVDEPGAVTIETTTAEGLVTVHLTVAPTDVGKVIGKQGRTARSMRTILACASMKAKLRCELNILEYSHQKKGAA
jgi:predicted RNA-binding protein YlqC (UPF0109 family)